MTSQITRSFPTQTETKNAGCRPPKHAPADYCQRLKSGIMRLRTAIQTHYEGIFPGGSDQIARAIGEAEKAAWATPFPSLFFPTLAHLRVRELMPTA